MPESADTYYHNIVSGVENRQRLCLDSMIGPYPGTAKRGSLVKAQPGEEERDSEATPPINIRHTLRPGQSR